MGIYNAWLVLFEIFDPRRGLAFSGKPLARRNNEFLNIRLGWIAADQDIDL